MLFYVVIFYFVRICMGVQFIDCVISAILCISKYIVFEYAKNV